MKGECTRGYLYLPTKFVLRAGGRDAIFYFFVLGLDPEEVLDDAFPALLDEYPTVSLKNHAVAGGVVVYHAGALRNNGPVTDSATADDG